MEFIKGLLRNLALLIVIGFVLYLLYPTIFPQIFQLYGALFGPLIIILLIAAALPRKRKSH